MKLFLPGHQRQKNQPGVSVLPLLGKLVKFTTDEGLAGFARVSKYLSADLLEVHLGVPDSENRVIVTKDTAHLDLASCLPVEGYEMMAGDVREFSVQTESLKAASDHSYTVVKDGDTIIDYQNVVFEGYASTFASVTPADRDGDYVQPYAFRDTLKEFRRNPVMLTDHRNSCANLVGSYSKIGTTEQGLLVRGTLSNSPDEFTKRIRFLVAEEHLKTLSIGGFLYYGADGRGIEKAKLLEITLTPIPANQDALFTVKGLTIASACKAFRLR